ncbi:hypothetical protein AJ80_02981 [Polytolypa hystricis UAMH7299]|uniref:HhH-GPD domain-containing protein n=1 Tax=Polytolypa hystricis (strain UAMH7299) TaxID=1447883 RepID=A0A2B7YQ00_POLH7|nr:hypothetical protein AJ80_02981 [Polytolypa hystricis UAMH7299]
MAPRRSLRISTAAQQTVAAEPVLDGVKVAKKATRTTAEKTTTTMTQRGGITKSTTTTKNPIRTKRANREATPSAAVLAAVNDEDIEIPDAPSTPKSRGKQARKNATENATPVALPQRTPPRHSNNIWDEGTFLNRPVDPHRTNAPLITPHGSHITAYPLPTEEASPSKTRGLPRGPTTTTTAGTLLQDAIAHLVKVEPRLKPLIEKHSCTTFSPAGLAEEINPFEVLASGIIGQQVSGAAAASIKRKFLTLFKKSNNNNSAEEGEEGEEERWFGDANFPPPEDVVKLDIPTLRTAGLSQRKAEYIQGLAEKFASGELSAHMLLAASDEEVMEKLIAVRGLGKWSVEMFSCFGLKRLDVFSTGDLGVQRGMAAFVGRDVSKLKSKSGKWKYMAEQEMLELAAPFSPYRSLFMWYMWRAVDVDVTVLDTKKKDKKGK